ncbi:MAG: aminotransferase class IV [Deltaproteobacteria bacterium]|nr:aminotransferase class IV [Deltaproteobacteria bacterium]
MVNGRLVPTPEARIPAWDPGALTADGVYETMLVPAVDAVSTDAPAVVARDAHLDRLLSSLDALRLPAPPRRELERAIDALLTASRAWLALPRALRLTVTAASITALLRPIRLARRAGLHLHRLDGARLLPRHKTLAWFPMERLHPAGGDPRFEGVWLAPGDMVLEGLATNLFAIVDGVVRTAPTAAPILPGVTRARALAHLAMNGVAVDERPFSWADLVRANEAFATSSTLPIAPILAVEGAPKDEGPVTRALRLAL